MAYAENTTVGVHQTRQEMEKLLKKKGAAQIVHVDEPDKALVMFKLEGRLIRFSVPVPQQPRQDSTEKLRRQRWRALLLVIKAKLESVESHIATIEEEFLAHVVMPDNTTVAEWIKPALKIAYDKGQMPTSALALPPPRS